VLQQEPMPSRSRKSSRVVATLAALAAASVAVICSPPSAGASASTRVVGGSATPIADYPWQAAVRYDASRFPGNDAARQFCDGVVVTPRIVLTAAHCVFDTDPDPGLQHGTQLDPDDADVVLNETTLSLGDGEHHTLQATFVQPGNDHDLDTNDVGYLVLSSPTSQTPIKLAGPTETALWPPGAPTIVSGYGSTSESSGTSNTLRSAVTPIISDPICADPSIYGSDFISSSMVCAGFLAGGVDACFGDSGGPLQAPAAGGVFRLVGLVSWGTGCAEPNAPGVYARVGAGAPGTLEPAVVDKLAAIEADQGLPHTDVVGSGALPIGTAATAATKKKCKRGRRLVKRHGKRKCVKKKHHHRR
jgi:trypsin